MMKWNNKRPMTLVPRSYAALALGLLGMHILALSPSESLVVDVFGLNATMYKETAHGR